MARRSSQSKKKQIRHLNEQKLITLLSSLKEESGLVSFTRICTFKSVYENFDSQEWSNIFSSCETWEEADNFFNAKDFIFAYKFKSIKSNRDSGLIFFFIESLNDNGTVSVHGGGWMNSLGYSKFYMNVLRLICNKLYFEGVRVHTCTNRKLKNVLKFNKKIGFKIYKYTNNFVLQRYFKPQPLI